MLSNRRSAHNSMVRKKAYVSDLERKAEQLEQQKKVLSAKVHTLEVCDAKDSLILLKFSSGFFLCVCTIACMLTSYNVLKSSI
jgi:hypothetical protein